MNKGEIFQRPRNVEFSKENLVFGVHIGDGTKARCAVRQDGFQLVPADERLPDTEGNTYFPIQNIVRAYLEISKTVIRDWIPTQIKDGLTIQSVPDGIAFEVSIQVDDLPVTTESFTVLEGGFESSTEGYYHFLQELVILTNQPKTKSTWPNQPEHLYIFSITGQSAEIEFQINYQDGSQTIQRMVDLRAMETLMLGTGWEHLQQFLLDQGAENITSWTVSIQVAGIETQRQEYVLERGAFDQTHIFAFKNSLGKIDHITCTGRKKTTLVTTTKVVFENNPTIGELTQKKVHQEDFQESHKISTGYQDAEGATWLAELLAANEAWEYFPSTYNYKKIIVGKTKSVVFDDDPKLIAHRFDYEYTEMKKVPYTNPTRAIQAPKQTVLQVTLDTNELQPKAILSWTASKFTEGSFEIWRGTDTDNPDNFSLLLNTPDKTYTDATLVGDTTYSYQIRSQLLGEEARSNIISVTTPAVLMLSNVLLVTDLFFGWDPNSQKQRLRLCAWEPNLGDGLLDAPTNRVSFQIKGVFNLPLENVRDNTPNSDDSPESIIVTRPLLYNPGQQVTITCTVTEGSESNSQTVTLTAPPRP